MPVDTKAVTGGGGAHDAEFVEARRTLLEKFIR